MKKHLVLVFGLTAGCTIAIEDADRTAISCADAAECPTDYRCELDLGFCVPTDPGAATPPALVDVEVTPTLLGPDAQLTVRFESDQALLAPPTATLVSGGDRVSIPTFGGGTGPFIGAVTITGSETEGEATLSVDLVAITGAITDDAQLGSVTLDFTAPAITSVSFDEEVVADTIRWVESTSLTANLEVGSDAVTVSVTGDVTPANDLALTGSVPVVLSGPDGAKTVSFAVADAAGNVANESVPLRLETTAPSSDIRILEPTTSPLSRNADAVAVTFEIEGDLAGDFESFVASIDSGQNWDSISIPFFYVLDLSTRQNASTELWIRERDVFGNLTDASNQAVLIVDEDSIPPEAPRVLTQAVAGALGSQSGVMVVPSSAGSEPLEYVVTGAGRSVRVSQSSLVPFFDVPQAEPSSYSISAVDLAGNSSTAVGVTVVDSGLGVIDPNPTGASTEECASCPRGAAYVGAGVAGFAENDGSEERITMCRPIGVGWECDQWAFTPVNGGVIQSAVAVSTGARNLVYEDQGGGSAPDLLSHDMGVDQRPGTPDDGTTYLITGDGQCPVMSTTRMVYAGGPAGSREIRWRDAGVDGIMGNGNDTDTVLAPTADFDGTRGCETLFTGRYVLWRDKRSAEAAVYLYDLGSDSTPNVSDPGEALVFSGVPLYFGLADNRILIQAEPDLLQIFDLGTDRVFGTADDSQSEFTLRGLVEDASGDKFLATPDGGVSWLLHDIGSQTALKIYDGTGTGTRWEPMLGYGFIFGLVSSAGFQATVPAYLDFLQTSAAFHFDESISVSGSGGALDGELVLLGQTTVRNTLRGGSWSLPEEDVVADDAIEGPDPDLSTGKIVWRTATGQIALYDFGEDGIPGNIDDRGPDILYPRSGQAGTIARWPRVNGNQIVWVELSTEFFSNAPQGSFSSTLVSLDLGNDGRFDGTEVAREVSLPGLRPLSPDLEGDTAVFLHRDGDQCGAFRGTLLNAECETEVWSVSLSGGPPTALTTTELPRAQLQVSEGTAAWTYLPNTISELVSNWNVAACPVSGCPSGQQRIVADRPLEGEYMPYVADGILTYFVPAGPIALEAGTDRVFGASGGRGAGSDDVPIRLSPPLAISLAPRLGFFAVRHQHHSAEGIILQGGVVPVNNPFAIQSQGVVQLIEGEEETTATLTLDVDSTALVDSPIVVVEIDIADESGIDYELISPAGTRVVLGPADDVETRFSITSSPALLDVVAEPLAGEWTLVVINGGSEEGTISRWRIQNGS